MTLRRPAALLAAVLLAGAARLAASSAPDVTLYPAAKVAMPELGVPVGVRAVGMGEAYTAAGGDLYSLQWNPAGLARIGGYQLGLMHNEWSSELGLRQEYLGFGMGLGQRSGLGLSLNYFSLGTLNERAADGALGGESGAFSFAGSLGWAGGLGPDGRLKLGLGADFGQESLFKSGSSTVTGGLGLLYDATRAFSLGLSVVRLGAAPGGFSPPSAANLGLAYTFNRKALVLAVDGGLPFNGPAQVRAGAEANLGGLSVRGGWRQQFGAPEGDPGSGFTAGAGFRSGVFSLDYAFVPYGELSSAHRVAATIDLPADFFKPKVVGAESSTTTAKTYFDKAQDEERGGNLLQALVQYQRAKDAYPADLVQAGTVQNFYRTSLAKIESIQHEMNKAGNNEQVRKLVARALSEGRGYMDAGRYREALRRFTDALNLDASNKEAKELRESAESGLRRLKAALLAEAQEAYENNRLGGAIQKYREVEALDEGDDSARAFFRAHDGEIKDFLMRIHRKGIDLYISGRIRDAVRVWKDGQKLDRDGVINFGRDIEKAEKVLEVQGAK